VSRQRAVVLVALALAVGATCVRLGFWQLERLGQRREENARTAARLDEPVLGVAAIPADSSLANGRRVRIEGRFDFDHEIVLVHRSREGAPGVNLLTPLRPPGRGTAVMVNRGWVYSPDGASVNRALWREPEEATGTAYLSWRVAPAAGAGSAEVDSMRRVLRVDPASIAAAIPYPVAPYQLILLGDSSAASHGSTTAPTSTAATPVRLPAPALDEGPHRGYAIQWFSFAMVVVIGTASLLWSERARDRVRGNGRRAGRVFAPRHPRD
jgi:surfeit locus 1 family protein